MSEYLAIKINGTKHDLHRVIVENKLGRKLRKNESVHHIDGNKHNNNPDNLEVILRSKHARMHARETLNGAKLTPSDVRRIRMVIKQGVRINTIAQAYGVDRKAISCIKSGRTWAWLK